MYCLSPRYRLDDELPWLVGIDPSRHYWIAVNGDKSLTVAIPGLTVTAVSEIRQVIHQWRSLQPGEQMTLARIAKNYTIHCISYDCYAIASHINGAPVWHLFDEETLYSLFMTAHPDWQCAPSDVDLGRKILMRSFAQAAVSK
ncbi:hypothetical protein [Iningainema tapete]|uniref:Uncharacterized protein n=1 Tax=Iningainema tapete BLCC-T55 TaxID=2748662 RepID=A0A8J6XHK8_9CYAN|nr:hypothetical protein [Iningainema tapete]MBD2773515.1 hypothetical protein [Iningainema tapete BLCC-T55]